ncbi:MAG: DNA polymerase domain-containing protein [Actinomycetota bacterium]|nr:DNA polymerase domain-containing protein [Actinomycetota bacterium]
MKISFWLLDVNYEVLDDGPEIRLWGIDHQGQRALILDRGFLSSFYILPEKGKDPKDIAERIKQGELFPEILEAQVVTRKYFGKPVESVQIICRNPDVMSKYAKRLIKMDGIRDTVEDDIRYSSQYLIDREIFPCGWHEVQVEEVENELACLPAGRAAEVDKVYLAKSHPQLKEGLDLPSLRILGLSLVCYSPMGTPKPERDPVVIISLVSNDGEKRQFVAEDGDDRPIIEGFLKYISQFSPDILLGYGSNGRDWPYLLARCKRLGFELSMDRMGKEPHTSLYGHVSVTGRANVDLFDFAQDLAEVKVKTLENVAEYLGIKGGSAIEDADIPFYWEDEKRRTELLKYSMDNTMKIMGIGEAMLDYAIQLSNLVGLPLDHVGTAAVGFRVDNYLIRQAHKLGELIPKRVERPYFPYVGAIVLPPEAGIHEKVAVLDFKAMYPNLMILYNISPDTYVKSGESLPDRDIYIAPEVGYKFRKEPPGFYKQVLLSLIKARDEIRKRMKELKSDTPQYRVLDARQKAVKVITNACYGYAGWIGARWYLKPVAEATAAWGRAIISRTIQMAKNVGLQIIYGDTDSLFVAYESEKIENFGREVQGELGLEIRPDKIYDRILFTEAKKRYAGLLPDDRLEIVGLEVVRGDWATIARDVQETVLGIILKERSPEKAASFVRQRISEIKEGKTPPKDLIIWKTLTKPLKDYTARAPHVEAAKRLLDAGYKLTIGDKIGYVILKGPGKLYERAVPYTMISPQDIDIEYYISNQILPAALRILELFQISEEDLT